MYKATRDFNRLFCSIIHRNLGLNTVNLIKETSFQMVKPISLNNILFISIVKYLSICIHFKMLSRTSKKAFKFRIPMANNKMEYMIQWHFDEYMVLYNG